MKDDKIKDILSDDLQQISSEDFNEKIIQQLELSKKKKNPSIFNQKSIVIILWGVFLFILGLNLYPSKSTFIIGTIVCTMPLLFIVFNTIYLYAINQNQNI